MGNNDGRNKFLALRSSLRALPAALSDGANELETLNILRKTLTSVILSTEFVPESQLAKLARNPNVSGANFAPYHSERNETFVNRGECANASIRSSILYIRNPAANFDAWHAAVHWASTALVQEPETLPDTPSEEFFRSVIKDHDFYQSDPGKFGYQTANLEGFSNPLWPEGMPVSYSILKSIATDTLLGQPSFAFWKRWIEGFETGRPITWDLQRRIALIDDAIWNDGPQAIAQEIKNVEATFLTEKIPLAERINFDIDSGKFRAIPHEIEKPVLISATLTQVRDALEDVLVMPANGLHENSLESRKLNRTFDRHGNDPQQIEMGFASVLKGLSRQFLNDDLPASEGNLALRDALEEGVRAIHATHPDIAEHRKILNEQVIRDLPDGAKEQLEEALPLLVAISNKDLANDWQHDIPQLINDATLPLPSGAPPLPGADETTRIFSRAAKISIWMKASEVVHRIDGSAGYKAARIVTTIAALVSLGIMLIV